MCCLRRNPFNRKNVYKLLEHPFVQGVKDLPIDDDKTENGREKRSDQRFDSLSPTTVNGRKNNRRNLKLKLGGGGKEDLGELTISNYDKVISDVEKKGQKDKVILELQRDLDDKTSAIETKLKAKKSQTESKATPLSESPGPFGGTHFFPHDMSQNTQKDPLRSVARK